MPVEQDTLKFDTQLEFAEGSPINLETGEFPMTLVTQGENSHGAIPNIAGFQSAPTVPLLVDHANSATANVGSITKIRASQRGSMPVLKAVGQIELTGDGANADFRRDLAHMIAQRHLRAVSIGIQIDKLTDRADLPKEHPAYIDAAKEKDFRKRFGVFIEKFTVLEGSLVAVGADKRAIINRAELAEPLKEQWTQFLGSIEEPDPEAQQTVTVKLDTSGVRDYLESMRSPDFAQVNSLRTLEKFLRDVGASASEAKRIIALCRSDAPPLRDVEDHPPKEAPPSADNRPTHPPAFAARDVQRIVREELSGLRTSTIDECVALVRRALGKVD